MNALALAVIAAVITLAPSVVAALTGVVAPLVVSLASKAGAPASVKRFIGLVVAAGTGFLAEATTGDGSAVFTTAALTAALLAFVVQQVSYLGLWRKLNVNQWKALLPALGLGASEK